MTEEVQTDVLYEKEADHQIELSESDKIVSGSGHEGSSIPKIIVNGDQDDIIDDYDDGDGDGNDDGNGDGNDQSNSQMSNHSRKNTDESSIDERKFETSPSTPSNNQGLKSDGQGGSPDDNASDEFYDIEQVSTKLKTNIEHKTIESNEGEGDKVEGSVKEGTVEVSVEENHKQHKNEEDDVDVNEEEEEEEEEEDDDDDDDIDDDIDDDDEEAEIIDIIDSTQRIEQRTPSEVKSFEVRPHPPSSPERHPKTILASPYTSPQKSALDSDDVNSSPTATAKGTIDYGSYSKGPKDRLVSRLVSNFESQMDSDTPKVERRAFGKAKLKTIVSPVASTFPNDVISRRRIDEDIRDDKGDDTKEDKMEEKMEERMEDKKDDKEDKGEPYTYDTVYNDQITEELLEAPPINSLKDNQIENIDTPILPTEQSPQSDSKVIPDIIISDSSNPNLPIESTATPKTHRSPTFQLKPIETVKEEVEDDQNIIFGVCVVGFHHARGPEVEYWVGPDGDKSNVWPYLAFQSLPDGSHVREENFCYFTLLYDNEKKIAVNPTPKRDKDGHIIEESDFKTVSTLFGISCNRQIKTEDLKHVTDDITRSTVQKSVVVVARKPIFGPIKEKLAVVTRAYFIQGDFEDRQLIDNLYENLTQIFSYKVDDASMNIGMPLRELIYRLGSKVLVILKALLLEKKVLFFASNTELLCASQFSVVSLIPNLINNLEDCGSPLLSSYETNLKKPTSLRTSDRSSLLAFMGLPLQLFAGGGIFSPYVPLQQLSELQADETKYFLVGSTNSLVLTSRSTVADVIVNMDDDTVEILNKSLDSPLSLSHADKAWIESIYQAVHDTWNSEDPAKSLGLVFHGSEDYIRLQFEDYIMHLLSSVKYDNFLTKVGHSPPPVLARDIIGNPLNYYNKNWVKEWKLSNNYRIFNKYTDEELFDIIEPKHLGEGVGSREGIAKSVSKVFGNLWGGNNGNNGNSGNTSPPKNDGSTIGEISDSDTKSLAESVETTSHKSQKSVSTVSSSNEPQEGYFAGLSRWAARRRQRLASTTPPNQSRSPSINTEQVDKPDDDSSTPKHDDKSTLTHNTQSNDTLEHKG